MLPDEKLLALRKKAAEANMPIIEAATPEYWSKQSNCTDWTVKQLLNHLISEIMWIPDMLSGKTIKEVGNKYDGDVSGEDPAKSYRQAWEKALKAQQKPGVLDEITHLSYGDFPARKYLMDQFVDLVIHGWDIAKSTGQDYRIDPELVDAVLDTFKDDVEKWRESGVVGPKVDIPETADKQTKLLALFGRRS